MTLQGVYPPVVVKHLGGRPRGTRLEPPVDSQPHTDCVNSLQNTLEKRDILDTEVRVFRL